ncbi:MAG: DUF4012 domain-containing protein [Patescibacteria group bacterium]
MSNKIQEFEHNLVKEGEKVLEEVEGALHLKSKKKPFYRKIWLWIFVFFFTIVALSAIGYLRYYMPFKTILDESQRAQSYFLQAQEYLLNTDFKQGSLALEKAKESLILMEDGINKLGVVAKIGVLEKQYLALKSMILAGQNLSSGLKHIADLSSRILLPLQKTPDRKIADIDLNEKKEILKALFESSPEIQGAKAEVDLARIEIENIDTSGLHPMLANYVKTTKVKLDEVYNTLDKIATMSRLLPNLMGYPQTKTYLFLLENNNELRPTGGFIGTIGVLKIENAEIQSFETRNVYDLDVNAEGRLKIKLPKPIDDYMQVDYWYLRDSNWSPDFPTSASKVQEFFNLESRMPGSPFLPQKFDGVIAITPQVIQDFLGLAGAIEVNGFVFNKDNFTERLQYLVEVGYDAVGATYETRKNIIGILSQDLFLRFEKMQLKDWLEMVRILEENLKEKHILVYLNDPVLQDKISSENWTGEILETPLDFLMFVDANLAALKTDEFVKKTISYQIYPDENGDLTARASINYKNQGSFTWKSTRYRTYTRLYVPEGSKLIKTIGSMADDRTSIPGKTDVYNEFGKTVFGAFISIEPDEEGTLSFEYKLPDNIKGVIDTGHYNLLVQKQPGTKAHQIFLDLIFNKNVSGASPAELKENWGDSRYQLETDLKQDREFKVSF